MDAVYKAAGEKFHELHPNVTIEVFSTDLRGFEQKLTTSLPTSTSGDVISTTANFLGRFIDQGLLAPIPDDIQATMEGGAYNSYTIDDVTYQDKLVGVPNFTGRTALYYNTDMLAEAGLPGPPKTMDQIVEYAKKLAKLDSSGNVERAGLSLRLAGQGSGVAQKWWIWLEQQGKSLLTETSPGKWRANYNNDEGVATFQMYVDMLRDKVDDPNLAHDAEAFEKGLAAMFVRESWVVGDIAANAPDLKYGTIHLPDASYSGTESFFVPAASPNAEVAWDFVRFMMEEEQQLAVAATGWLPTRTDLDYAAFVAENPGYDGFLNVPDDYRYFVEANVPENDEIQTKLATHLVEAFADYANLAGQPDKIRALLDTWAAETNEILEKNGHYGP